MVESALSLHGVKDTPKHRLFRPALRMAEARKERFAVQNHCGIRREYEIGEIGCCCDEFYFGTARQKGFVEHLPLAARPVRQ